MTLRLAIPELQRLGMTQPTIDALLALEAVYEDIPAPLADIGVALGGSALSQISGIDITAVTASTNYTTTGTEDVVVATAAITVSLNATPDEGEKVAVKRATTAGYVVVDGNGNTIDGGSDFTLVTNYDSFTFVYADEAGGWVII